jgi:thioredoxin reductase (NADPH)
MNFSGFAKTVTVVIRGDSLKSTLSSYLIDRISAASNVKVLCNTEVIELHGGATLQSVTLTNNKTREKQTLTTKGLFICIAAFRRRTGQRR